MVVHSFDRNFGFPHLPKSRAPPVTPITGGDFFAECTEGVMSSVLMLVPSLFAAEALRVLQKKALRVLQKKAFSVLQKKAFSVLQSKPLAICKESP